MTAVLLIALSLIICFCVSHHYKKIIKELNEDIKAKDAYTESLKKDIDVRMQHYQTQAHQIRALGDSLNRMRGFKVIK
jgi:hypothetical protein